MSGGRPWFVSVVVPVAAVLALVGALLSIHRNTPVGTHPAPRIAPAGQPSPDTGAVSALGLVEAESEQVGVGALVAGVVTAMQAVPGGSVHAGDILFKEDSRAADAEVALREDDLRSAEAHLAQERGMIAGLRAQLDVAQGSVEETEAALADAADLRRGAEGTEVGLAFSRREATKRRNDASIADARLRQARARLALAGANLAQYEAGGTDGPILRVAEAAVRHAGVALAQARTALDLLTVRAPFDATVLQVNLRLGEFAPAGALAALPVVLGTLDRLRLRVDIDEADIPRFTPDAEALASPRGRPTQRLKLRLIRIEPLVVPKVSLSGAGPERVDTRVLRVLYAIDTAGVVLYPGQQMDVYLTPAAPAAPVAAR